jgi:probable rRNA maturation factor
VKPLIILNRTSPKYRVYQWDLLNKWLTFTATKESRTINTLSYTLLSDREMLNLNRKKLRHDFYTDIVTFDLGDSRDIIDGDIYISYDRIKENALSFNVNFKEEFSRVILHGLLHLIGYNDKTNAEKLIMRQKEEEYLKILKLKFHVKL